MFNDSYDFHVDTNPMAETIDYVSERVNHTTTTVAAMQTAVIAQEVASTTLMNIELRKQTMIPKVQQLLGQVVLPECGGNQGSPEFLEFVGWTKKALTIIQDPTPIKRKNTQNAGGNIGGIDFSSLLS